MKKYVLTYTNICLYRKNVVILQPNLNNISTMAIHNLKLIANGDKYTYKEIQEPFEEPEESNYPDYDVYLTAYDEYRDKYTQWVEDNDIILFDDEDDGTWDDLIVYFDSVGLVPNIITWGQLEYELDKDIIEELKKNHHYELRDKYYNVVTDEPDEQLIKFKVIIPTIEKL